MKIRDEVEIAVSGWDAYERTRSSPPIIDYDCRPDIPDVEPVGRLATYEHLQRLAVAATEARDAALQRRIGAHIAYLRGLLGERLPLDEYVRTTQGCPAAGWPPDYVTERGQVAQAAIAELGIGWGPGTENDLNQAEGLVDLADVPDQMRELAAKLEQPTREVTGARAPFTLDIETVDIDDYWSYWLDGAQDTARVRINLRNARFTEVRLREIVLHEVMGHALQGASYADICANEDVPWVRLLSVHAQQQVLLEGLAQALPLFVCPDDQPLMARTRLAHYLQLVRAELHLAINDGAPVAACVEHARQRAPFWTDEQIGDILTDRGANVLLRSYLWSYPAGIDWFTNLADNGDRQTVTEVLHAAYQRPLCPEDLSELWPSGPPIGGWSGPTRLP